MFHWVDYYDYYNGLITIRLSEELKPYLLGLNMLFTEYGYNSILSLPTSNSIRLLELLISYASLTLVNPTTDIYPDIPKESNEIIFSINYLKDYFNCKDKYPNNNHFIKWVIDQSVKGINTRSTYKVSYRIAKQGRSIGYVLFKINAWNDKDFREFVRHYLDNEILEMFF
jgi:plasmid replication initiation protein